MRQPVREALTLMRRVASWLSRRLWPRKAPSKTVFLEMSDGKLVVATAYETQSGYAARWIALTDQWTVLLPGGEVAGTRLVKGWLPRSGWTEDELRTLEMEGAAYERLG